MRLHGRPRVCRPGGSLLMACFLLFSLTGFAQDEVKVRGGFLSDSLKIGEETAFYLSARYPSQLTVLFPDSTHAYAPFEYVKREYFLTETREGISRDSTVYYLTTFEVDRLQALSLPVYVVQAGDCTLVHTGADTVRITQMVAAVPDSVSVEELPLKMNTTYEEVSYDLNVWMIAIITAFVLIIAAIAWALFGKKISSYFMARRLKRNHEQFSARYAALVRQLQSAFSTDTTESALSSWKKYMEQLEARPYTKLTTRETLRLVKEPALNEPLRRIDRAIYGHEKSVVDSLENLKQFADRQFDRKMKEVQHGK